MRVTGSRAWGSALLAVVLVGLGVGGCGNGNNGVTPGPTPQPGSEFVFVPDAVNNVLNVLVIGPDGSFNNGPVPFVGTGVAPVWAAVDSQQPVRLCDQFHQQHGIGVYAQYHVRGGGRGGRLPRGCRTRGRGGGSLG